MFNFLSDKKPAMQGYLAEEKSAQYAAGDVGEKKEVSLNGHEKMSRLYERLGQLAAGGESAAAVPVEGENSVAEQATDGAETIADDIDLPPEVQTQIMQDESVVREALALFNVDYNALMAMDDTSAYGRAVQMNPQILDMIAASERPVLAALKVAVEFGPYVEFMNQYGDTPEAIKAAMRDEMLADMKAEKQGEAKAAMAAETSGAAEKALPFSTGMRSKKANKAAPKTRSLSDVLPG